MKNKYNFIYVNLNSIVGKYIVGCLVVGNVVISKKALKLVKKYIDKKECN